jgi:hypothetical protein
MFKIDPVHPHEGLTMTAGQVKNRSHRAVQCVPPPMLFSVPEEASLELFENLLTKKPNLRVLSPPTKYTAAC